MSSYVIVRKKAVQAFRERKTLRMSSDDVLDALGESDRPTLRMLRSEIDALLQDVEEESHIIGTSK